MTNISSAVFVTYLYFEQINLKPHKRKHKVYHVGKVFVDLLENYIQNPI